MFLYRNFVLYFLLFIYFVIKIDISKIVNGIDFLGMKVWFN